MGAGVSRPLRLQAPVRGYGFSMNDDPKLDDEELERQRAKLLPEREAMSLVNPVPDDMPTDPPLVPMPGPRPPAEDTQ